MNQSFEKLMKNKKIIKNSFDKIIFFKTVKILKAKISKNNK